jgi:hypothetical protein
MNNDGREFILYLDKDGKVFCIFTLEEMEKCGNSFTTVDPRFRDCKRMRVKEIKEEGE